MQYHIPSAEGWAGIIHCPSVMRRTGPPILPGGITEACSSRVEGLLLVFVVWQRRRGGLFCDRFVSPDERPHHTAADARVLELVEPRRLEDDLDEADVGEQASILPF